MDIILASKSPRRKFLLEKINLKFQVLQSNINENTIKKKYSSPAFFCKHLAEKKSTDIAEKFKKSLIIGADTIVYHNKNIYNKPNNRDKAIYHLKCLSGQTHIVYTGVSLILRSKNIKVNFHEKTYVTFHKISNKDMNYYVDKYNPYDKAGSYGIQDLSMIFVKKINGCFNNVVGFPVSKFYKLTNGHSVLNQVIQMNRIK